MPRQATAAELAADYYEAEGHNYSFHVHNDLLSVLGINPLLFTEQGGGLATRPRGANQHVLRLAEDDAAVCLCLEILCEMQGSPSYTYDLDVLGPWRRLVFSAHILGPGAHAWPHLRPAAMQRIVVAMAELFHGALTAAQGVAGLKQALVRRLFTNLELPVPVAYRETPTPPDE